MAMEKIWLLYDGRYITDPEYAMMYESCESLREAKENSFNYGCDTVIVEAEISNGYILNKKIL